MADQGRGNKIRTYNFICSRAVDHRTGNKTSKVWRVIERGEFDLLN
jgi:protein subunit release factor A